MRAKQIPIDEIRRVLDYDPETGLFRNIVRRASHVPAGGIAGYTNTIGYVVINHAGKLYHAHRLAWAYVYGHTPTNAGIDHINGIRTDNRISNLRLCDQAQNSANSKGHRDNPLPKGVKAAPHNKSNPFRASIMVRGKSHNLGYFKTKDEAEAAYRAASLRLNGAFSRHASLADTT